MSKREQTTEHRHRSAEGAFGLDGKYIQCSKIYEQESEFVFNQSWICLGRTERLGQNGIWPICVDGNNLVVVEESSTNEAAAECRVFRNFCRHRGSRLVTDENCNSIGKRIQCPYHAWTFERNGNLVSAPNMNDQPGFDASEFGLIQLPCQVWQGFIWVWLGDKSEAEKNSLSRFLEPLDETARDWQFEKLRIGASLEYVVNANWKLIFQNYSECYHCPSVHPALNLLTPYQGSSNFFEMGPILGGPMNLADDSETMSSNGRLVGTLLTENAEQQRGVFYFTVCPSIFISAHPDYVLIHYLYRESIGQTRVLCDFLFHPVALKLPNFDPKPAVEFWDLTNRQDWNVCELAHAGMSDPGYIPGPYSDLESIVAAFDSHYLNAMNERHG